MNKVELDVKLSPKSRQVGGLLLALGIIALGIFFLKGVFDIRILPSYARVGPRFFPLVVSIGLLICGAFLAVQAWLGQAPEPQEEENVDLDAPISLSSMIILGLALFLYILLLERLGFILSSALLFVGSTLAFGDRQYLKNSLWGLGIAFFIYFMITRLLNLNLPEGLIPL